MESFYVVPEDVEKEILSRLTVKSLLRFKCVCKSWHVLIESQTFIDFHLSKAATEEDNCLVLHRRRDFTKEYVASVLCTQTLSLLVDLEFPYFEDNKMGISIVGSCNGLVCLCDNGHLFAVFNPATREFKALPILPSASLLPNEEFDFKAAAFGYDPITKDYKVLQISSIFNRHRLDHYLFQIYTLSTNTWREIDAAMPAYFDEMYPLINTYRKGVHHWSAYEAILSFDINREVFGTIKLPTPTPPWHNQTLSLLNGSLATIIYHLEARCKSFDIWVMKEYGVESSWTKQYTIGPLAIEMPLGFWKGGELLMETRKGKLILYDLHTRKTKRLLGHGHPRPLQFYTYVESLVLIKNKNQDVPRLLGHQNSAHLM
ncbi:unnamed protein product [Ilex paraguariensis]|uniref:F-box domain-containing protein n=1 Tax=Ilex paraguariensis TaxID=185542 RepID=A0ABC8T4B3_9AQUA